MDELVRDDTTHFYRLMKYCDREGLISRKLLRIIPFCDYFGDERSFSTYYRMKKFINIIGSKGNKGETGNHFSINWTPLDVHEYEYHSDNENSDNDY